MQKNTKQYRKCIAGTVWWWSSGLFYVFHVSHTTPRHVAPHFTASLHHATHLTTTYGHTHAYPTDLAHWRGARILFKFSHWLQLSLSVALQHSSNHNALLLLYNKHKLSNYYLYFQSLTSIVITPLLLHLKISRSKYGSLRFHVWAERWAIYHGW